MLRINSQNVKTIIDYNEESLEKLNQNVYNINWYQICSENKNINQIFKTVENKFREIFAENIHKKQIIFKKSKFPKHIKKLII